MDQPRTEPLARRAITAFMAGDLDGVLAVAHPEIVVRSLLTEAEREYYHGHGGVREWFDAVFGVFPDWRPEPQEAVFDEGEAVVIKLEVTATAADSRVPIAQVYWLGARSEADKIRFIGFFRTQAEAVDALK